MPNTKEKVKILVSDFLARQKRGQGQEGSDFQKLFLELLALLANNFQGIEKLKGEKGDSIIGPQGERGERGGRGERGLVGLQGERGEMGSPGTRGKDGKDGINAEINIEQIKTMIQEIIRGLPKQKLGAKIPPFRGGGASLVYNEIPTGAINGSNITFTLANTPRTGGVMVYQDGVRLNRTGYTISGRTLTMNVAPASELVVDYAK